LGGKGRGATVKSLMEVAVLYHDLGVVVRKNGWWYIVRTHRFVGIDTIPWQEQAGCFSSYLLSFDPAIPPVSSHSQRILPAVPPLWVPSSPRDSSAWERTGRYVFPAGCPPVFHTSEKFQIFELRLFAWIDRIGCEASRRFYQQFLIFSYKPG
jgi:hypothetical protein